MLLNTSNENKSCFLGIDIGGTWIKGCVAVVKSENQESLPVNFDKMLENLVRVKSPLSEQATVQDFIGSIHQLIEKLGIENRKLAGIGISTGGIVDYAGKKVLKAAAHLAVLKNDSWISTLEKAFDCPAVLINDADAACIGISELGILNGNKTVGIMPIGTGLGFTVWRNGRRWRPGKMVPLLGSIRTPTGFFDTFASASKLAASDSENDLIQVLTKPEYGTVRLEYLENLAKIMNTAAIIYHLDEVMICGGLADAVTACHFPLQDALQNRLGDIPVELDKPVKVSVLKEGNRLQLIGAISLAKGESVARANQVLKNYKSIKTEIPYQMDIQLQNLSTIELIDLFSKAEQEAGEWLKTSLPALAKVIDEISDRIEQGGRLIYVGSGTSGRIAAMDAVEIPCPYGFPEDRILCIISGGIADASIEIESDFEEDASAVPEMLLMNVQSIDVVIGISASGTAYYVQSALAFAKDRGAYSVLMQSDLPEQELSFCNATVAMNSGNEVVAGSTRMKSGTATKKILNFISSTVMIKMGKVAGPYMIDVACINSKLIERAQDILGILYDINKDEALQKLQKADMQLSKVISKLKNQA
jgi:N-acetylmuramic acid 6-phosphate etherase